MLSELLKAKYQPVMGLEVHIQLQENSKMFSTERVAFGGEANERVSPITLAHPGALPSMNAACINATILLGLATGCRINQEARFARKNYFYPDLPKGYQLSQDREPVCLDGKVEVSLADGSISVIELERIHLEEDAGKSIHDLNPDHSLIDLNRAGVGLMEMVTRPDFRNSEEVAVFLADVRRLVRYLGISDADMEKGNMRCDANISVMRKGSDVYGTRVEVKNLNSIRNAVTAIHYEIERQVSLLEAGKSIEQETRTFQVDTGITLPMRDKETADDYRYFPEPDLLPLRITEQDISRIQQRIPELPKQKFLRYQTELGISAKKAQVLIEQKDLATYFEALLQQDIDAETAANWLLGPVKGALNERKLDIASFPLSPPTLSSLAQIVLDKKVSLQVAKGQLWEALLAQPDADPLALAQEMGLLMESQEGALEAAMRQLMAQHPDEVKRYQAGKKQLAGFFVGQLMRQFKGKADPKEVNQVVRKELGA